MSFQILIVEDDENIARLLELELGYEGFHVGRADTGKSGLSKALSDNWDLILLDIMIPEMNGLEVLRRFRQTDIRTPVILLTARDEIPDIVSGLDQGANDYMTKPFEIEELLARIRACIRSNRLSDKETIDHEALITLNGLSLHKKTREVKRDGARIDLTPKEYDLLLYLMENRNQVLSREQIISHVWGFDFIGDTNVVDVYIRYLRKKIDYPFDDQLIQTYRGVGYSIKESENEH
ncbi:response regulator transcription factor [Paenibacillus hodogayensis]|uniref:Response regulator transcription factor n=1 Tax=Paenibacillus hodogayensis TaxID=279208 RepID=A0ABV5W7P6_9BACL